MLRRLHPRQIFTVLDRIDSEPPSYTLARPQALRRIFWTLTCVAVCLLLLHYGKYSSTLRELLALLAGITGADDQAWLRHWQAQGSLDSLPLVERHAPGVFSAAAGAVYPFCSQRASGGFWLALAGHPQTLAWLPVTA